MSDIFFKHVRGRGAYIGDLFNLIFVKLERWQDELLNPLDEATTILLEALQKLSFDMFFKKQVRLALLLAELLDCSRDDVVLVDLRRPHLL